MNYTLSAADRAKIPSAIITELEELLDTKSMASLKKLSDRVDNTFALTNAQRGWLRYWLRSELFLTARGFANYRYWGYESGEVFISDTQSGRGFPVSVQAIQSVQVSSNGSLEKIAHWLTIGKRTRKNTLAA